MLCRARVSGSNTYIQIIENHRARTQGRNRRHPALRRRAAAAHHTLHRRAGRRERNPAVA